MTEVTRVMYYLLCMSMHYKTQMPLSQPLILIMSFKKNTFWQHHATLSLSFLLYSAYHFRSVHNPNKRMYMVRLNISKQKLDHEVIL